ncbi:HAMP domain-containing protein [Psychromonas sp. RZ22]|uniref:ATP-binding protein n=1 Tax=Psychromonas algarum TaxID=2555643 RepID=UPI00106802E7|nr:ATP-binding protein [Psychromonas sp. RZ22]TEW53745.1 HAMP domain-containing protein [Psychromonas sp. RZ22]
MRFTLFKKILISMLFICTLMVLGMAWLINYSFQSGLKNYVNRGEEERMQLIAEQISPYYSEQTGWKKLTIDEWEVAAAPVFFRPVKGGEEPKKLDNRTRRFLKRIDILDESFISIFNNRKPKPQDELIKVPIKQQEKTIGWVVTKKHNAISGALERSFYHQQQTHFMWVVLWMTLLSFVLAWLLVRHFLTPLKRLENAACALQEGDYSTQIEVSGEDELAALSNRFNELSRSLLHQKESREQWLADISHELRTPISVLKSEIEAIQDGIRKAEPKYINSLHYQVQNLSELVNDLYQLSLSDEGIQFDLSDRVDVLQIINTSCAQYQLRSTEKNIQLQTSFDTAEAVWIEGDKKSLTQLLSNLLENSLRYTDAPGSLKVHLSCSNKLVNICIEDSAPGVPEEALPKLFERLYRVDKSRSRLSGGAGLGLSICQKIVQAHQGKMVATHSQLGGLAITISLPLSVASHK